MTKPSLARLGKCVGVGKAIVAATATIASLTGCVTIQTPPVTTSPSPTSSVATSPSPLAAVPTATPTPVAAAPVAPPVAISTPAAPAGMLVLGTASTGQTVKLDTNSIPFNDGAYAQATYYLGEEKLDALINCGQRFWNVNGSITRYTPQSQATENLVRLACQIRQVVKTEEMSYFVVFDPPSNVRSTPNGSVKCVIENMEIIKTVGEPKSAWYQTTACGGGWISQSQVRPLR